MSRERYTEVQRQQRSDIPALGQRFIPFGDQSGIDVSESFPILVLKDHFDAMRLAAFMSPKSQSDEQPHVLSCWNLGRINGVNSAGNQMSDSIPSPDVVTEDRKVKIGHPARVVVECSGTLTPVIADASPRLEEGHQLAVSASAAFRLRSQTRSAA